MVNDMILNEEMYIRDLILGQNNEVQSIKQQIDMIARYNYHILKMSDSDNYKSIVGWMNSNNNNFCENNYSNVIEHYIKKAAKNLIYKLDGIKITENELITIRNQNNIRYEKILFVLLCMAKFQREVNNFDNGLVVYNITKLFKDARVSVAKEDREGILHELLECGLIGLPVKNNTKCLIIKFIDDESDVKLTINDPDCNELAYTYLKFIGNNKIFRCKKCGKLIKQTKKYGDLCKECGEIPKENRIIKCEDCGKNVLISIFNSKTTRCETCQHQKNNAIKRKYREKMMMIDGICDVKQDFGRDKTDN